MPPAIPYPGPHPGLEAGLDVLLPIREDLDLVEAELARRCACDAPAATEIGEYLRQSGGKRIRPALVLLGARYADCALTTRIRLAAIVEMIHAATLVHDDIIDAAATRRGRPSANARWGNQKCVLAGDWLYMQAFRLALEERHFGILDALIALTQKMVEGELLQLDRLGRVVTAAEHLDLIERKTARLFQVSSQLGAMAAGLPQEAVDRLSRFGRHLGLAFQMVDDILDLTADERQLGKPVGNDLREGKMTLPAIYAYEASNPAARAALEQVMRDGGYGQVPFAEVRRLVEASGGLERARAESREHARWAEQALETLPPSPWRDALARLPELVIGRST